MVKKPMNKQTLEEKIDLLTRLFIESVQDTCEEPEIVDLVHCHIQDRMGLSVQLEHEENGTWTTHFGENGFCTAIHPIAVLRGAYREWRSTMKKPPRVIALDSEDTSPKAVSADGADIGVLAAVDLYNRKRNTLEYPELEVIEADAPDPPPKLNWKVREYMGSEIYRLAADEAIWPKDPHAWAAYQADPVNVWTLDLDPPAEGDKIVVQGLTEPFVATVRVVEVGDIYAETDTSIISLCSSTSQPSDDRNAWVSCGILNKRAIEKLELYSDADEKQDPKPTKD